MAEPIIQPGQLIRGAPAPLPAPGRAHPGARPADGGDFAGMLRRQLESVSQMQHEADEAVKSLITGQTQSVTEVFSTARKAQVAFNMLMEIRNKLADAYTELRQMRV